MICCVLLGSLIGFFLFTISILPKIFLGDSGALMIGFIIGFLSLLGFKKYYDYCIVLPNCYLSSSIH
ncbi:hypothetical protein ACVXZZ_10575 [Staphylococcus aureus]